MPVRVILTEDEIPRQWYNLAADLPTSNAATSWSGWKSDFAGYAC